MRLGLPDHVGVRARGAQALVVGDHHGVAAAQQGRDPDALVLHAGGEGAGGGAAVRRPLGPHCVADHGALAAARPRGGGGQHGAGHGDGSALGVLRGVHDARGVRRHLHQSHRVQVEGGGLGADQGAGGRGHDGGRQVEGVVGRGGRQGVPGRVPAGVLGRRGRLREVLDGGAHLRRVRGRGGLLGQGRVWRAEPGDDGHGGGQGEGAGGGHDGLRSLGGECDAAHPRPAAGPCPGRRRRRVRDPGAGPAARIGCARGCRARRAPPPARVDDA